MAAESVATAPPPPMACCGPTGAYWDEGREAYPQDEDNQLKQVALEPVSTFSIDVDTAPRNKSKILSAVDNMRAGGSTAGGAGIELAYRRSA